MIKWTYKNNDDAVRTEKGELVFYIDGMSPDVITKVVRMYNEGKAVKEIQKYLDKDEPMCTLDEADYVIGEIENWLTLNGDKTLSVEDIVMVQTPPKEERWSVVIGNTNTIHCESEQSAIINYREYIHQSKEDMGMMAAGKDIILMHGNEVVDEYISPESIIDQDEKELLLAFSDIDTEQRKPFEGDVLEPKDPTMEKIVNDLIEQKVQILTTEPDLVAEKVKRTRRVIAQSTTPKKQTPADIIQELIDSKAAIDAKIALIHLFTEIRVPELPAGLNKVNRETMLEFHKEYDTLVQKYLEIIVKG